MESINEFYQLATDLLSQALFNTETDDAPLLNDCDKIYIAPSDFEAHIKQTPSQNWPAEFRKAALLISEFSRRCKSEDIEIHGIEAKDIFCMTSNSLIALAKVYIPSEERALLDIITNTTEPQQKEDTANLMVAEQIDKYRLYAKPVNVDLPRELDNLCCYALFGELVKAGYLNEAWKPTVSCSNNTSLLAYIAKQIGKELLCISSWCKLFTEFWNIRSKNGKPVTNLSAYLQKYERNGAGVYGKTDAREVDMALAKAVKNIPELKQSRKGMELLRRYDI